MAADVVERGLPDLATEAGQAEIDEVIVRDKADLIFIDNCSTIIRAGKENEGESWIPVQSWALAHRFAGRGYHACPSRWEGRPAARHVEARRRARYRHWVAPPARLSRRSGRPF